MKKFAVTFIGLCLVLAVIGCNGTPSSTSPSTSSSAGGTQASGRKVAAGIPQVVKDALKKAPEDALVGIGTARMGTISLSRTAASTRARAEISRQLNTMLQDMVRDYTASSEVDPNATISFTENITVALSKSQLTGASVVAEEIDDDGNYWAVVMLTKTNAVQEINQAQAAAKLAVPAMASFNAEQRMNEAFAKQAAQEIGYASN